jgi:gluconokinase
MHGRGNVLAVDIGTSATKAVLFDGDARILAMDRQPYPVLTPRGDWAEQDPDRVCAAVMRAMGAVYRDRPAGIGVDAVAFSAQWYSIMPVGGDDRPLSNYLTWSDRRSAACADQLRRVDGAQRLFQITGCPLDAIYPLSKILWLKAQELDRPPVRFISIKEYVFRRLFGEYVVDWSMASPSGLFDIRARRWSGEALAAAGISERHLSPLVSPRTVLRRWTPEAVSATGIPQGTPCVIGGGDGALASIGAGAIGEGLAAVNVGTSAAARCLVRQPLQDYAGRLWTYLVDEGWWVIGGIVSSGGIVYDWFAREMAPGGSGADLHAEIDRLAGTVAPGAEDLLFLPYLSGEQCPVWDPETSGAFVGLTHRHGRGHLARAVLEGMTGSLARVIATIREAVGPITEARVTGGLIHSATWLQIAADMFDARISVPTSAEGSALGAAMLAWVALGAESDLAAAIGPACPVRVVEPEPARTERYRQVLVRSERVLAALKSARG